MSEQFDIKGNIVFTDQGASATIDKVTKAVSEQGGAAEKSATQVKASGEAAKQASTGVGQFGSSVGLAGQAVSRLSPALGGLVTMAGSSLGAIQSLTTAGLGPLGLAVAGVSLAISAGTALYNAYEESQKDVTASTRTMNTELWDAADAFNAIEAAQTRATTAARRGAALALGQATEQQAAIEVTRLEREIDAQGLTNFRGENDRHISQLEDRLAMVREGAAAARAAAAADEVTAGLARNKTGKEPSSARTRRGGGGGGGASDADRAAADEKEARLIAQQNELQQRAAYEEEWRALEQKGIEARLAQQQEAEQHRSDLIDERNAINLSKALRHIRLEQEAKQKAAKAEDDILKITAGAHTMLAGVIEATAGSSAKAQKAKTQALAAATMVESGIQAAVEVAKSIASYPDPVGIAMHALAAASFTAAAIKAAGEAGGGGGGASGGGGAPATATPGGGPALSSGAQERGGDTVVINIGSKGMVYASDRAQLFRDIDEGISQSRSRLGRSG